VYLSIVKPTWCAFHSILLRINGLYMFRALLAHHQEAFYKRHLVYCMRVMSAGCTTPILVQPTDITRTQYTKCRSRNNQHYALICTTPLFYILAPACFGSNLPSSGSFLGPPELLEIQIEWVVYHIMPGYVACVLECRGSVCWACGSSTDGTTTIQHTGHITTHYMIYHIFGQ
jgi:hypothetical protein